MTFLELLELDAEKLEALSDEQLLEYLKPCLIDCPPIDLAIVQEAEAKVKLEKLQKKTAEKEQRKLEKSLAKASNEVEKKVKPKVTQSQLDQLNAMMELTKKMMESNKPK